MVQNFLATTFPDSPSGALWNMDLNGLEDISTPDDLYMRIGTRPFIGGDPGSPDSPPTPQEVKFLYAVAGSLVEFLLQDPIEDGLLTESNFGALYRSTPLRPSSSAILGRSRPMAEMLQRQEQSRQSHILLLRGHWAALEDIHAFHFIQQWKGRDTYPGQLPKTEICYQPIRQAQRYRRPSVSKTRNTGKKGEIDFPGSEPTNKKEAHCPPWSVDFGA